MKDIKPNPLSMKYLVLGLTLLPMLAILVFDARGALGACYRMAPHPHYCGVDTDGCSAFCRYLWECESLHGSTQSLPVPWTEPAPSGVAGKTSTVNAPYQYECTVTYMCTTDLPEYCGSEIPQVRRKCEADEGRIYTHSYINPPILDGSECTG